MMFLKVEIPRYIHVISLIIFAESHPNYSRYSHLLSDGWIPGRKVVCICIALEGSPDLLMSRTTRTLSMPGSVTTFLT